MEYNCELSIVPRDLMYKFQPLDITISQNDLKPLHAKWVVKMYDYLKQQKESITKEFV